MHYVEVYGTCESGYNEYLMRVCFVRTKLLVLPAVLVYLVKVNGDEVMYDVKDDKSWMFVVCDDRR